MVKKSGRRVSIPRNKYSDYEKVAQNFCAGAEVARTFEYWNAAGVLIVHAAIAITDAVTIKIGGVKNRGEDHMAAADLVRGVVLLDEKGLKALQHFSRIIEQKNIVSYNGEIYVKSDIDFLWKHLERYLGWANQVLQG